MLTSRALVFCGSATLARALAEENSGAKPAYIETGSDPARACRLIEEATRPGRPAYTSLDDGSYAVCWET